MKYVKLNMIIISILVTILLLNKSLSAAHYQRIRSAVLHPRKSILSKERAIRNNTYASTQAQVRLGNTLHIQESAFIEQRLLKVRNALEALLERPLEDNAIPRIAVVCSGGGCRAMLGTVGALSGLQDIGVLDATTYISSLSGSTWALGLWMATGMTLSNLKRYVMQRLTRNLYRPSVKESSLMGHMLVTKLGCKQPCTVVDLFGGFLANNFLHYFGENRQMVHLSDQVKRIQNGDFPCPIYTAVDGRVRKIGVAPWYEFTPFEIGSAQYAAYVPSWAYGRHFNKGISSDDAPEQSLGFHFGVFGSAFATHAGHVWNRSEHTISNGVIKSMIDKAFQYKIPAHIRLFWAQVPNFMFGLQGTDVSKNKNLKLVDAGLECNLPYLPVSGERAERKQDVLIFFDFSKSKIPSALKKAEEYARVRNLKFPKIDYTDIEIKTISIFKDEQDLAVPVVIYMPRISDAQLWQEKKKDPRYKKYLKINNFNFEQCTQIGFCNTTNFQYTRNQSQQVMDQMEFNVVVNKDKIIDAIRWVVEGNKKSRSGISSPYINSLYY
jgi:phospholipase A2